LLVALNARLSERSEVSGSFALLCFVDWQLGNDTFVRDIGQGARRRDTMH